MTRTPEQIADAAIRCDAVLKATRAFLSRPWVDRDIRDHLKNEIDELVVDMRTEGIPFLGESRLSDLPDDRLVSDYLSLLEHRRDDHEAELRRRGLMK